MKKLSYAVSGAAMTLTRPLGEVGFKLLSLVVIGLPLSPILVEVFAT